MKQLACEMCGSTELIKQDGVFVCQSCGCKYSVEEAKQMMKEVEDVVKKVETVTETVKEATNLFKEYTGTLKERNNELFALSPKKGVDEAQYYVLEHLRDADYVADDIFENLNFDESQSAFTFVAVFGGPITYHWTASSGFDREEKYTEYVEKTEVVNGKVRTYKEPETRTRIVTDWRPSSGTVSDYYVNHFVIDGNNFSKEDGHFRRHISSSAARKEDNAISLWQIYKDQENGGQIYDELKNSIPQIKNRMIAVAERSSGSYDIPGDHVKDLHDSADFRLEAFKLIAYPIVKGQYKYKQQSYDFAVDAIDGNSNNVTVDFPVQTDDKEKHDLVIEKAEQRKNTRIRNKETLRNNFIYIEWTIAILLMAFLVIEWFKNGVPSLIFPGLILLFSVIWHYCFNSKFQKDIANLKHVETQRVEQIKQFVQNENNYKKYLRQESFVKFISNSGNEKFIAMAQNFAPEKNNANGEFDEIQSNINEQENNAPEENILSETTNSNASKQQKNKIGIICLAVIAIIVALIVLISTFGNRINSDLVGTWRAERDSSISITFKNNGDMIVRSSNHVDDDLSYKIDDNTVIVTYANNDKVTYGYVVEGDTLIFGEYYYSRIE